MAASSCVANLSLSGGSQSHYYVKANGLLSSTTTANLNSICKSSALSIQKKKSNQTRKLSVSAEYGRSRRGSGGGDFVAGFLLGGALFGAAAYIFAPQIRRSIMSEEDEYGFKNPQERPSYYDEGLEKTRETLNEKIGQLNSAIDNVSSRLRGREKKKSPSPVQTDPEVEATT